MPHPDVIKSNKALGILGDRFLDPELWSLNRRSAAAAFFVGIFFALLPVPFQMLLSASCAILLRCNLPISVCLVWITNPLTMPVVFYFTYKVGCFLLNTPVSETPITISLEWISHEFSRIWLPLYLGSLVTALIAASLSYFAVRLIWRWQIIKAWQRRRRLIKQLKPPKINQSTQKKTEKNK